MKRTELRLPEDLYAKVAALAQQERRSLNQEIVILLQEALHTRQDNLRK